MARELSLFSFEYVSLMAKRGRMFTFCDNAAVRGLYCWFAYKWFRVGQSVVQVALPLS